MTKIILKIVRDWTRRDGPAACTGTRIISSPTFQPSLVLNNSHEIEAKHIWYGKINQPSCHFTLALKYTQIHARTLAHSPRPSPSKQTQPTTSLNPHCACRGAPCRDENESGYSVPGEEATPVVFDAAGAFSAELADPSVLLTPFWIPPSPSEHQSLPLTTSFLFSFSYFSFFFHLEAFPSLIIIIKPSLTFHWVIYAIVRALAKFINGLLRADNCAPSEISITRML